MSNPVAVKWFSHAMAGAPTLAYTNGTLIAVLDACLKDGFGSVTLSSLVVSSGVATATVDTGHGFLDHTVVRVSGATPGGLNGDKRITVTGANTFTFDATGISNQTATGTIAAKMAPLDWEKVYSGTNKAAYRPQDVASSRLYYRFEDAFDASYSYYATVVGYESMSGIDTGSNPFPASPLYIQKNLSQTEYDARPWVLIGDGAAFYLIVYIHGAYPIGTFVGDVASFVPSDAHGAAVVANEAISHVLGRLAVVDNSASAGHALCRNSLLVPGSVPFTKFSSALTPAYAGYGGVPFPNKANNGLLVAPIYLNESGIVRGMMPGYYSPLHSTDVPDGLTVASDAGLSGRMLMVRALYGPSGIVARAAFDLTGPWR